MCQKYSKYAFTQGNCLQHRKKIEVLKIKGCTKFVVGYRSNLLAFVANLSKGTSQY